MVSSDLIAVFFASTIISSVVSFILKVSAENKLKHHFNVELEKLRHSYNIELEILKSSKIVEADTAHELLERRFDFYPKMIELVYRIRNMSRELSTSIRPSPIFIDELEARGTELEENLYTYRMDLERDGFFDMIHPYKNKIKIFIRLIKDYNYYILEGNNQEAGSLLAEMQNTFRDIEINHKPIIKELSTHLDNPPMNMQKDS